MPNLERERLSGSVDTLNPLAPLMPNLERERISGSVDDVHVVVAIVNVIVIVTFVAVAAFVIVGDGSGEWW